uniref:F-box domain-containing protein n=1 Tax=Mycena chlorophos TaxID=658473 RepID=A0ABQ0LP61_MYCCL|nr:predicted protein [Mycena chlorophos]
MPTTDPLLDTHACSTRLPSANASKALQRAALSRVQDELARCKSEALTRREMLLRERRAISAKISRPAYPVLTLPNELTSTIFVACLPTHGRVRPSPHAAPLLLTQICSHWRAIALETTQLWSSIDVVVRRGSPAHLTSVRPGDVFNLVDSWRSRAKTRVLSLTIRGSDEIYPECLPPYRALPCYLYFPADMLRRLEASIFPMQLKGLLPPSAHFPNLEHVAGPFATPHLARLLKAAPKLHTLYVPCPPKSVVGLSSTSLVSLTFGCLEIEISAFLDLVANLPSLKEFSGSLKVTPICYVRYPSPSLLPKIISLDSTINGDPEIFEFLTLPNLEVLGFYLYQTQANGGLNTTIQQFLLRSQCTVTELKLNIPYPSWAHGHGSGQPVSYADIPRCLDLFPKVQVLSVTDSNFSSDFIPALDEWTPFMVLPCLRNLTVEAESDTGSIGVQTRSIIELLHRRRRRDLPSLDTVIFRISDRLVDGFIPDDWFPNKIQTERIRRLVSRCAVEISSYEEEDSSTVETHWASYPGYAKRDAYARFDPTSPWDEKDTEWENEMFFRHAEKSEPCDCVARIVSTTTTYLVQLDLALLLVTRFPSTR